MRCHTTRRYLSSSRFLTPATGDKLTSSFASRGNFRARKFRACARNFDILQLRQIAKACHPLIIHHRWPADSIRRQSPSRTSARARKFVGSHRGFRRRQQRRHAWKRGDGGNECGSSSCPSPRDAKPAAGGS